jgi:hypothetical protein
VLVEGRILRRRGTSSKGRAHLEEGSFLLRRGAFYGRWRAHGKGGCYPLVSFCLSRAALELKCAPHLWREAILREGSFYKSKAKASKGSKDQANAKGKGSKAS